MEAAVQEGVLPPGVERDAEEEPAAGARLRAVLAAVPHLPEDATQGGARADGHRGAQLRVVPLTQVVQRPAHEEAAAGGRAALRHQGQAAAAPGG
eukprot:8199378-Pyramimonas_sp.AAC.1